MAFWYHNSFSYCNYIFDKASLGKFSQSLLLLLLENPLNLVWNFSVFSIEKTLLESILKLESSFFDFGPGGPPGGCWIPISREQIGHNPKSRKGSMRTLFAPMILSAFSKLVNQKPVFTEKHIYFSADRQLYVCTPVRAKKCKFYFQVSHRLRLPKFWNALS